MGYVLPEVFEDYEFEAFPGLEVKLRVSPVALRDILGFQNMTTGDQQKGLRDRYARFIELAKPSWNMDETPSVEGFMRLPFQVVLGLMTAWTSSIMELPVPLRRRSNGGDTLEAKPRPSRRNSKPRSS
jgi:hypothetical protein